MKLTIFNVLGQEVAELVNARRSAGRHRATWNGIDGMGKPVSSGIYFYSVVTDDFTVSRKMLLLK